MGLRDRERGFPNTRPFPNVCGGRTQTRPVSGDQREPPAQVRYDLNEALMLLAALEDARDASIDSGHLAVVVNIETEIRALSRKLGFDDPAGGTDGR
jgi:hypothetical protein